MNSISSSKNGTLLIVIALAMALLFAMYYYVVKPKQDEEQAIRSEINSLKTEITTIEETLGTYRSQQSQSNVNEFALRKKVPANREIDALILSIEEMQYVTDSRVQSIEFNNYDALVSSSGLQDPLYTPETEDRAAEDGTASPASPESTETDEGTEQTEDAELPVSTIAVETLPPSLKLVTFNINVASPNDVNLLKFIQEIEKKERVMHIDIIDFALPGEEDQFTEEASEVVIANIQITTFYYE